MWLRTHSNSSDGKLLCICISSSGYQGQPQENLGPDSTHWESKELAMPRSPEHPAAVRWEQSGALVRAKNSGVSWRDLSHTWLLLFHFHAALLSPEGLTTRPLEGTSSWWAIEKATSEEFRVGHIGDQHWKSPSGVSLQRTLSFISVYAHLPSPESLYRLGGQDHPLDTMSSRILGMHPE